MFLHGTLLVLQVPDAIMIIFILPFKTSLATTTVNVIFIALRVHVNRIRLTRKLLTAVWASHHCLLAVEQMVTEFFTGELLVTVHAFGFGEYAFFS